MTDKQHRREDVEKLYGLAASTLYRLISKNGFTKRSVSLRAHSGFRESSGRMDCDGQIPAY
ncbi:MAG: hypothetical protein OXE42_10380 [Gammaproteobacteria bacterium]|nr:hypothetical protein [Gammaproteobacteria bacterium]